MHRIFKLATLPFLGTLMLLITGCADTPAYMPPVSGPTAQLEFPQFKEKTDWLGGRSGGGIFISRLDEKGCSTKHEILPTDETASTTTIAVPAGQDIIINLGQYMGNYYCRLSGHTRLEPGAHYELKYSLVRDVCFLILQKKLANGKSKLVPLGKTKRIEQYVSSPSFCKA